MPRPCFDGLHDSDCNGFEVDCRPTLKPSPHFDPYAMRGRVLGQGGFLTADELSILAGCETSRGWPCLVRCGGGRFVAPADQVAHFLGIIARDGADYVRDVSLMREWGR